jgi:hypothetical protein
LQILFFAIDWAYYVLTDGSVLYEW